METVEVDGSFGEGGGQILRTASSFAVILRRPIRVTKIRSGRKVPGLRPQHASSLEILRQISDGRLEGAHIGSTEISFFPGAVKGGSFAFDLGTAASVTLVLQALVPAVALSGASARFELVGGTDVLWSPTYDYFARVVRDAFKRAGVTFSTEVSRRGYYPRGGGRVRAEVEPCASPLPLTMVDPDPEPRASLVSRCGKLPRHVAERQLSSALSILKTRRVAVVDSAVSVEDSDSPGSSILVWDNGASDVVGADAIGERGKPAERVGEEAAVGFATVCASRACVDSNLADMLAPILALSSGESRLRIPVVTQHLETSLYVAGLFTGCRWAAKKEDGSTLLTISP